MARDWWTKLAATIADDVRFFSRAGRTEREKAVVRELLRTLDLPFSEDELVLPKQDDDVDVSFRDAAFQNVEQLAAGRRRHDEYRDRARCMQPPYDVRSLEVARQHDLPMSADDLVSEVIAALAPKTGRMANRHNLDALAYLNAGRRLHPAPSHIEDSGGRVEQLGWRSVTALCPPYCVVLSAAPNAPRFLRERVGRVAQRDGIPWDS